MQDNNLPLAQFTTNSFVGNPFGVIFIASGAGMTLMMTGISLGSTTLLSFFLLFGGIGLVFGYNVGKVQYSLLANGIEQRIRAFIPYTLYKKEATRFVPWENIKSYKIDTDFSRSLKEYEFIKLYLKTAPGQIWITDQINPSGFALFKEAFEQKMQEFAANEEVKTIEVEGSFDNPPKAGAHVSIEKRKSFYQTIFAKLITLSFVFFSAAIVWFGYQNGLSSSNWVKVAIVILPGTGYMVYRVFFTRSKS